MSLPRLPELERAITGRAASFFADDVRQHADAMRAEVAGRRVLVVGGGGSIGGATTRALLALGPRAVHVVDVSENYLAELVREVRSSRDGPGGAHLQTHVFDYGSAVMQRFLAAHEPFDVILNFAAVKHVRSEKDVFSLLHMLDVNIVRHVRFKEWLARCGHGGRYFAVSTDKAANPSSLMGASKRVMEDVAFDVMPDAFRAITSARFANVAFSNGSLLQSFLARIEKGQPLAAPVDTRRYFITHAEAAEICLLACLVGPDGHVLIPKLQPHEHLLLLQDVAQRVLRECGFEPWFTHDEAEAKRGIDRTSAGKYPVLLTPLDTSGEKPYEEFLGEGEQSVHIGFESLLGLRHVPGAALGPLLGELNGYLSEPGSHVDKERLTELLLRAVPTMRHVETGRALDARM